MSKYRIKKNDEEQFCLEYKERLSFKQHLNTGIWIDVQLGLYFGGFAIAFIEWGLQYLNAKWERVKWGSSSKSWVVTSLYDYNAQWFETEQEVFELKDFHKNEMEKKHGKFEKVVYVE